MHPLLQVEWVPVPDRATTGGVSSSFQSPADFARVKPLVAAPDPAGQPEVLPAPGALAGSCCAGVCCNKLLSTTCMAESYLDAQLQTAEYVGDWEQEAGSVSAPLAGRAGMYVSPLLLHPKRLCFRYSAAQLMQRQWICSVFRAQRLGLCEALGMPDLGVWVHSSPFRLQPCFFLRPCRL